MSNNHRWVRIQTLEEMTKLLKVENVVIAQLSEISGLNIPEDADNFLEFFKYYNESGSLDVSIVDPKAYRTYQNTRFLGNRWAHLWFEWAILRKENFTQGEIPFIRQQHWHCHHQLTSSRFAKNKFNGFYLLQETKMEETFGKITKPEDIPADGIIYNLQTPSGTARKVFEHPKGEYQVSKAESFSLVNTDVTFQQLQKQYVLKVQQPVWHPLCYDIADGKALDEVIVHLKETFVSTSGITPDEYYDELNKDHL